MSETHCALIALQVEALQEDKRALEQGLTQCREQLDRLRSHHTTCLVRLSELLNPRLLSPLMTVTSLQSTVAR